MTKEEMNEILHVLGLDEWRESDLMYVFYRTADGVVHNFSLGVRRGREMSDEEVVRFMRREYPASRMGEVLTVERPERANRLERVESYDDWLDVTAACDLLKVGRSTLYRWIDRGVFHATRVGSRTYISRSEIERILRENIIQENGRIDATCPI